MLSGSAKPFGKKVVSLVVHNNESGKILHVDLCKMPRGMAMEEMSKEEYYAMNQVRKEIWNKGIYGYGVGASASVVLHTVVSAVKKHVDSA